MEPFLRSDQFNFIKRQAKTLINGHSSVNDMAVLNALKSLAIDKVLNLSDDFTEEQKQLLNPIVEIKDTDQAEKFFLQLEPFVIPFNEVTENTVKKLFPKAKKLKAPAMKDINLKEISYLGWDDIGSNRRYIIANYKQKLTGLQGTFRPINSKGICTVCHKIEEIGMFMTKTKGAVQGTYTNRGNYICQDSQKCNQNITSLDKLEDFIQLVSGK